MVAEHSEPVLAYVLYGPDGIITGAALACKPDARAWLEHDMGGRTLELVHSATPIRIGMKRSEIVEVEPVGDDESVIIRPYRGPGTHS